MLLVHGITGWLPKILSTKEISIKFSSYLAAIPLIIGIFSALIIPRFSNNKIRIKILTFLFINAAIALSMIQSSNYNIYIFGIILLGISTGSFIALLLNHLTETKDISYENIGIASGLFFSVIEIGGVLGPFIIGLIYDYSNNFNTALSFYIIIIILMLFPLYLLRKLI